MSRTQTAIKGRRPRAGFTLIEVLIAVLILALGLLGLGAVFPMVARSQRVSADDTLGTAAANNARTFLQRYNYTGALRPWSGTAPDTRNFWLDWRNSTTDGLNTPAGSTPDFDQGAWFVPLTRSTGNLYNSTRMGVVGPTVPGSYFDLPVRERLYPQGAAGNPPPAFVWDLAVHRVTDLNTGTDATFDDLEVVVFVRRLDQRIKPPAVPPSEPPITIYEALTGERRNALPTNARRFPVAVFEAGPDIGLPSNDGQGVYASPITLDVEFRYNPTGGYPDRNRLYMQDTVTANQWLMVKQLDQRLVDNLGQVHTVKNWGENGALRYAVLETAIQLPEDSAAVAGRPGVIQSVVMTPQVPASVFLMRVQP